MTYDLFEYICNYNPNPTDEKQIKERNILENEFNENFVVLNNEDQNILISNMLNDHGDDILNNLDNLNILYITLIILHDYGDIENDTIIEFLLNGLCPAIIEEETGILLSAIKGNNKLLYKFIQCCYKFIMSVNQDKGALTEIIYNYITENLNEFLTTVNFNVLCYLITKDEFYEYNVNLINILVLSNGVEIDFSNEEELDIFLKKIELINNMIIKLSNFEQIIEFLTNDDILKTLYDPNIIEAITLENYLIKYIDYFTITLNILFERNIYNENEDIGYNETFIDLFTVYNATIIETSFLEILLNIDKTDIICDFLEDFIILINHSYNYVFEDTDIDTVILVKSVLNSLYDFIDPDTENIEDILSDPALTQKFYYISSYYIEILKSLINSADDIEDITEDMGKFYECYNEKIYNILICVLENLDDIEDYTLICDVLNMFNETYNILYIIFNNNDFTDYDNLYNQHISLFQTIAELIERFNENNINITIIIDILYNITCLTNYIKQNYNDDIEDDPEELIEQFISICQDTGYNYYIYKLVKNNLINLDDIINNKYIDELSIGKYILSKRDEIINLIEQGKITSDIIEDVINEFVNIKDILYDKSYPEIIQNSNFLFVQYFESIECVINYCLFCKLLTPSTLIAYFNSGFFYNIFVKIKETGNIFSDNYIYRICESVLFTVLYYDKENGNDMAAYIVGIIEEYKMLKEEYIQRLKNILII